MEENLNVKDLITDRISIASVRTEDFAWPKYNTDSERIKALSSKYKNCSCAEAFSQEYMVPIDSDRESSLFRKDFKVGETLKITGVNGTHGTCVFFTVDESDVVAEIDMQKEKRFLDVFNLDVKSFVDALASKEFREQFIAQDNYATITEVRPSLKLSLNAGFIEKTKEEFMRQIKEPKTAYVARIVAKNHGGFLVDVLGVQAFLPGSLAAANKIINFDEYIGKSINVMVEDYIPEIKTFIMSHKKYLEYVLPSLIQKYDWSTKHTGIVTGANKYGVFVEFYDSITGLLHAVKMDEETKKKFDAHFYKPGDQITCYVHDIQNNKLILTCFEPGSKEDSVQVGGQYVGKITGIAKFGTFVKLKTGEDGVIRTNGKKYIKGDTVNVEVTEILEDGKIFFKDPTVVEELKEEKKEEALA